MADWVLAAERAYVAAAVAAPADAPGDRARGDDPERAARALAAAGAIASRYLAVGTPRSLGLVIAGASDVAAAVLSLVAHRTWFDPRDVRCATTDPAGAGVDALAAATSGRAVSVAEALACDIVNVYAAALPITPGQLRRGTHVNAVSAASIDDELRRLATFVRQADLPALAAGLVDGRQLDELTIFTLDGAPIAARAV